jgi:hypothetical protein
MFLSDLDLLRTLRQDWIHRRETAGIEHQLGEPNESYTYIEPSGDHRDASRAHWKIPK